MNQPLCKFDGSCNQKKDLLPMSAQNALYEVVSYYLM